MRTVLETGHLGSGSSTVGFWRELSSWLAEDHFLVSSHGRETALVSLLIRSQSDRDLIFTLMTFIKALSPNIVTLEVRAFA